MLKELKSHGSFSVLQRGAFPLISCGFNTSKDCSGNCSGYTSKWLKSVKIEKIYLSENKYSYSKGAVAKW